MPHTKLRSFGPKPQLIPSTIMSLQSFLLVLAIATTTCIAQVDIAEFRRCARLSVERTCTDNPAFVRNRVARLASCNLSEPARFAANYCAKDDNIGIYCGASEAYAVELGMAQFFCTSSLVPGSSCSSECRNSLLTVRNGLGCCVNAFFNNTQLYASFSPVLGYSLWSSCGVDLPNDTCEGALPFTLSTTSPQICTVNEILGCGADSINQLQNSIVGESSCGAIIQYSLEACSMDANGDFCFERVATDIATATPIATSCSAARSTPPSCPSVCKETLQGFAENRGCCLNTIYNSTFGQVSGLNFTIPFLQDNVVFDVCNIETPPLTCTDGSLPLKSFTLMMFLPLIVALIKM